MRKGTADLAACSHLPSPDAFRCHSVPAGSQCGHSSVSNNGILSQVQ